MNKEILRNQIIPIGLTAVVFLVLMGILWLEISILNRFTRSDIILHFRATDIVVGLTIYLKTSVDFAIYIGRLMSKNAEWTSRIAIEIGTAMGNALGTMGILLVWTFFKEIRWLLALMIALAALVLFRLAEEGLEHVKTSKGHLFAKGADSLESILKKFNSFFNPILKFIIPDLTISEGGAMRFWPLFGLAFSVPFVLGLDDFAGYVPLFSIVNVFSFAIGVFLGHMILNIFLYLSPATTIRAVKNPAISFLGSLAFIGLGVWGITEVIKLIG